MDGSPGQPGMPGLNGSMVRNRDTLRDVPQQHVGVVMGVVVLQPYKTLGCEF